MSIMADQGNKSDALLNKLDSLMQSGHARRKVDAPPLLTDTVPGLDHSAIPTLTDAVEFPEATPEELRDKGPVDLRGMISSRLVAVVDAEMEKLSKQLPADRTRLTVLHRSLRFALPELVRLRWEETPDENTDTEGGDTDPEQ